MRSSTCARAARRGVNVDRYARWNALLELLTETGRISVEEAAEQVAAGRFIDDAVGPYPAVVLGAVAAQRLGITSLEGQPLIWIGDRWWSVVGILEPLPLAPEIDRSALVGMDAARRYLDTEAPPTTIYVRAADEFIGDVRSVLGATANPESPEARAFRTLARRLIEGGIV